MATVTLNPDGSIVSSVIEPPRLVLVPAMVIALFVSDELPMFVNVLDAPLIDLPVTVFALDSVKIGTLTIVTVPLPFGCRSMPMLVSVPFAPRAKT